MKFPKDLHPYPFDQHRLVLGPGVPDGCYVYVQALDQTIYVLKDGSHQHPKVLGNASPALYAGDLTLRFGMIRDLTNLSGTFQFDDPEGLLQIAQQIESLGILILPGAVRYFPIDGGRVMLLR